MKISESAKYDNASPDDVFGLVTDEAFRGHVCEEVHAIKHSVSVERSGDSTTITIDRVMPAEMPDFIKKMVGETVSVTQTERWGAAESDGSRNGTVDVVIKGQPAKMSGTLSLGPTASGSALDLVGDVTVKIPFVGKKVEPEVAKAILSAFKVEAREGNKRLGG